MADLCHGATLIHMIVQKQSVDVMGFKAFGIQIGFGSENHLILVRVNFHDKKRLFETANAKTFALTDGIINDTVVMAENFAVQIDDVTGLDVILVEENCVIFAFDEVLTFVLGGNVFKSGFRS